MPGFCRKWVLRSSASAFLPLTGRMETFIFFAAAVSAVAGSVSAYFALRATAIYGKMQREQKQSHVLNRQAAIYQSLVAGPIQEYLRVFVDDITSLVSEGVEQLDRLVAKETVYQEVTACQQELADRLKEKSSELKARLLPGIKAWDGQLSVDEQLYASVVRSLEDMEDRLTGIIEHRAIGTSSKLPIAQFRQLFEQHSTEMLALMTRSDPILREWGADLGRPVEPGSQVPKIGSGERSPP